MSDNLQDRGPQDRSRINLDQAYEVRYWSKQLGCTEDELREAVRKVGNSADAVRRAVQH
jgi:hypothetical protein